VTLSNTLRSEASPSKTRSRASFQRWIRSEPAELGIG
jgi:hypothetical protein